MKTIIELWNGNLDPIRYLGKNNSEIKQLEGLTERNLERLKEKFNDETKELFFKYNECVNEYAVLIAEQAFYDGFCLGTKITAEAMVGAEKVV